MNKNLPTAGPPSLCSATSGHLRDTVGQLLISTVQWDLSMSLVVSYHSYHVTFQIISTLIQTYISLKCISIDDLLMNMLELDVVEDHYTCNNTFVPKCARRLMSFPAEGRLYTTGSPGTIRSSRGRCPRHCQSLEGALVYTDSIPYPFNLTPPTHQHLCQLCNTFHIFFNIANNYGAQAWCTSLW